MTGRIIFASSLLIAQLAFAAELEYRWDLPKGFPKPLVPADNPMNAAKVELGHYLFYDTRMSVNRTQACASCHKQELAFTDGRPVGIGATGQKHPRGAMSLVNIAYSAVLTWSNPLTVQLEQQALVPMFGEHPVELGLHSDSAFFASLSNDPTYKQLFPEAFPNDPAPFTIANVVKAIACFERTIISARSPWDRYHYYRDDSAISDAAKRGEILFFSQPLSCFRCHGGFTFGDNTTYLNHEPNELQFHNTALYDPYPATSNGVADVTQNPKDAGKFKAPTLRNIAVTAPYMHDGSIATLDQVLEHYAAGGRAHANPLKDPLIGGFKLTDGDKKDLIAFLSALTDDELLHDPRFSNPWAKQ